MAPQSQTVVSIFTGIISSIIAYIQLNIAMFQYQADYEKMRATLVRLLSMPVARNVSVKRLNKRCQARPRRFWVRPGRTNAWWTGFVNQILVPEERRENFRTGRVSLHRLTEELRAYIEEKDTVMRSLIVLLNKLPLLYII